MNRQSSRPVRRFGVPQAQTSQFRTWLLAGVTLAIVGGSVGFLGLKRASQIDLNSVTLCPLSGPTAVHAVLLDQSDPITPLQAQRLGQVVDRVIEEAEIGERIDLYVLTADGTQALTPRLSLCRPKSEGSIWNENPKRIHDRYVARFRQPLDDALKALLMPSPTKTSPIMESIKAVCVAAFGALPRETSGRLTIASDMIQFSNVLNHYKQRDFDVFSKSPGYNEVLGDCHHAGVDVLYLVRPRDVRVQDRKHQLFWEKFFDHENASLKRMETI
jgi:hypothetical protein